MLSLLLTLALTGSPATTPKATVVNERCPVTGMDVRNHYLHHFVTVNNRTYYVYDQTAAKRLKSCPECFLDKEGQLLN